MGSVCMLACVCVRVIEAQNIPSLHAVGTCCVCRGAMGQGHAHGEVPQGCTDHTWKGVWIQTGCPRAGSNTALAPLPQADVDLSFPRAHKPLFKAYL